MKLKQISVPMENSYGRLYELTKALENGGITPRALTLVDTGNYGELRILVSEVATARQILMQKDIPGRIDDVVAVEIENTAGQLFELNHWYARSCGLRFRINDYRPKCDAALWMEIGNQKRTCTV
jgi:hypothetical protein